jgi:hypothetical protein
MFDIDSIAPVVGELVLTHPVTGRPLADADGNQPTLLLVGIDSAQHQRADREAAALRYKRQADKKSLAAEDLDEEIVTIFLVTCTVGWRNLARGGQPLAFSPDEARRLYTDPSFRWLRNAAVKFMSERRNFFPVS